MNARTAAIAALFVGVLGGLLWFFLGRGGEAQDQPEGPTKAEQRTAIAKKKRAVRDANDLDRDPVTVNGRVVEAGGPKGVAGAVVLLTPKSFEGGVHRPGERAEPLFVSSDAGGGFSLEGVPPGRYTISATARGYLSAVATDLRVAPGLDPEPITLALRRGGYLVSGVVEDVSGGPIEGALVSVVRLDDGNLLNFTRAPGGAVSNAEGEYSLSVPSGKYTAAFSHPDYVGVEEMLEVADGPRTLSVTMTPGAVVEGVVRARGTDAVVPGAIVVASKATTSAQAGGFSVRGFGEHRVVADGEGRFRLGGLPSGLLELNAVARGHASAEVTEVSLGIAETATGVTIWVEPAFAIRGFVVPKGDQENGAIEGAWIGALSLRPPGLYVATRPSETDGFFEIPGVAPGSYMVAALGEDTLPNITGTAATVEDADVEDVLVVMSPGVAITGRVEPPGIATVSLAIEPESMGISGVLSSLANAFVRTRSDEEGSFELHPVAPGKVKLVAEGEDGSHGEVVLDVSADGASDVVVQLEPRVSIVGTVVSANGEPVAQAKVSARRTDVEAPPFSLSLSINDNPLFGGGTPTKVDGSFELDGLEAGDYELTVRVGQGPAVAWAEPANPARPAEPMAVAVPDAGLTGVVLRVESMDGEIDGVVLGDDGSPLADAWVTAALEGGGERWLEEMKRAKAGSGKQLEATMQDEPEEGAQAGAKALGSLGAEKPVLTDASGRFVVTGLRDGTYRVTAEPAGGGRRATQEAVSVGSSVTLELEALAGISGVVRAGSKPVRTYSISVQGPSPRSKSVSNAQGSFAVEGLDPGEYEIQVDSEQGVGSATVELERGASATVDITLESFGTVRGKVVSATGEPLEGLSVITQSKGRRSSVSGGLEMLFGGGPKTDAGGVFEIDNVPPGEGEVILFDPDGAGEGGANAKYEVEAGGSADLGTITAIAAGDVPFAERGDLGFKTAVRDWNHRPLGLPSGDTDEEVDSADAEPPSDPERKRLWIRSVAQDGPAFAAGVRPGDEIVAIDGREVAGLGAKVAASQLGPSHVPAGDNVGLTLARDGSTLRVSVTAKIRKIGGIGG